MNHINNAKGLLWSYFEVFLTLLLRRFGMITYENCSFPIGQLPGRIESDTVIDKITKTSSGTWVSCHPQRYHKSL